ncbi:MAG: hypothetical protein K0M70_08275 [Arenimonas sp.]|uniref:hypothetical protein n=1 Tax=Arenimonas sp. TaxID=1872635 RepID=UPI0025B941A8|nr:hypothetical protein [Arenimonas sp.]MBW8367838.1 hypothetical protein [Arenimonas sp.]
MLGILDFFAAIFDLVVYWRMWVGLAITALVCWLLFVALPGPTAPWMVCLPVGVVGAFFAFRWQHRADSAR